MLAFVPKANILLMQQLWRQLISRILERWRVCIRHPEVYGFNPGWEYHSPLPLPASLFLRLQLSPVQDAGYAPGMAHKRLALSPSSLPCVVCFDTVPMLVWYPRREAGDVWCLPTVWNLRAVIGFHFSISFVALLLAPIALSVLSIFRLLAHSSNALQYFFFLKR